MEGIRKARWLGALGLAEAAGIAVVACAYAAVDRGVAVPDPILILGAGAFEGICLGTAQAFLLRRVGVAPLPWLTLTVLGAVLGYGLSLLATMGGGETTGNAFEPPLWLLALLGAGMGLGMGAVMGALQSAALPRSVTRGGWIVANLIGWAPAMAAIMLAASIAERSWPYAQVAALGAASGAVAGLCVALATWEIALKEAAT